MTIRVNGRQENAGSGETLLQFLQRKGVDPRGVAVEMDGRVVRRDEFAATALAEGSTVEIVCFVGGG